MNCRECDQPFPEPEVVDGVGYFVCSSCGYCHEIPDFIDLSEAERVELFKSRYGYEIPQEFVSLPDRGSSWRVKLPPLESSELRAYFGSGVLVIDGVFGLELYESSSVFQFEYLVQEWGLPIGLVPFSGDGHFWVALDYRKRSHEPPVVLIVSDSGDNVVVADSFKSLLAKRLG